MPAILPEEDQIPLACYGKSNVGKLKTLYRMGLGHRYGRSMQSIAGVHYNFSFSDRFWEHVKKIEGSTDSLIEFKNKKYFHLIRNYRRKSWMLMYLFGATPAVDANFLKGKKHNLEKLTEDTYISPFGTSLRMGGLGYTSEAQKDLKVCFNKVETYVQTLEKARLSSYPEYEKIGLKKDGEYLQLNTNLLQIDNEFYSTIRPKNVAKSRESALKALHLRGIEYIEVRLLDLDPYASMGITEEQVKFLHIFLSWCLLEDSDLISDEECNLADINFDEVVKNGRNPEAVINFCKGEKLSLKDALKREFKSMEAVEKIFSSQDINYGLAFKKQSEKIEDPSKIPSAKIIEELKTKSFKDFHLEKAKAYHTNPNIDKDLEQKYIRYAEESFKAQTEVENGDKLNFNDFLEKYFEDIKIDFGS